MKLVRVANIELTLNAGTYRFGVDVRGGSDYFGSTAPFTFDSRVSNVVDAYRSVNIGVYPSLSLGLSSSKSGAFWLSDITINGRIETN